MEVNLVWTDSVSTLLVSECIWGHGTWATLSKTKSLGKKTKEEVKVQLGKIGYNLTFIQYMKYEGEAAGLELKTVFNTPGIVGLK